MEGHSDSEERREEYFGEPVPQEPRRSPRLDRRDSHNADPGDNGRNNDDAATPAQMEITWIKLREGVAMRVWFLKLGEESAIYGADGSKEDITREELAKREVPYAYVLRYWNTSIHVAKCLHRAIARKFATETQSPPLPTQEQWSDWLRPLSATMHIEFACTNCGAKCKTFNRYAPWIDGAEASSAATCHLFGKGCTQVDMLMPESLSMTQLVERVRPQEMELTPTSSQFNEGMQTARETKQNSTYEKLPSVVPSKEPKRRIRRKKGHTRFTPLARKTKTPITIKKAIPMTSRPASIMTVPPNIPHYDLRSPSSAAHHDTPVLPNHTPLQWDEEASNDAPSPTSVYSQSQMGQGSVRSQMEMNQRMEGLAAEVVALRKQLEERDKRDKEQEEGVEEVKRDNDVPRAPIFSMTELEELRASAMDSQTRMTRIVEDAEEWIRGLRPDKIKPMAKAMGKVIAATSYAGDPHPSVFAAWCDSVRTAMAMWDVPPGPSQVQVATWFVKGAARTWWDGICSAKGYGAIKTLELLFEALRKQFQPQDAAEQCIEQWCSLKQTHTVTQYMNDVETLHNTWRLCEKAEFGLAARGLKKEIKGIIRRALYDQKRQWMTIQELKELALSAEVEKFDPPAHKSIMTSSRIHIRPRMPIATTPKYPALTMGTMELRNPKGDADIPKPLHRNPTTASSYRCGVCGMKNHLTTLCMHRKKEGCWRCGGKHMLRECHAPYNKGSVSTRVHMNNKDEEARTAVLGMIQEHTWPTNNVFELVYPVKVNGSPLTAIATLDTGAQCSAIRLDVAKAAGIDWTPMTTSNALRGVSGEPLDVRGKARLCVQAGGLTTNLDAWVVDGIRAQIILGLPWIRQEQPQVEWGDGATLVFPGGKKWFTEDEMNEHPLYDDDPLSEDEARLAVMAVAHTYMQGTSPRTTEQQQERQQEEEQPYIATWIKPVVQSFRELFTPLTGMPPDQRIQHHIQLTPGARPVMKRPYRLSETQRNDAQEQIKNALKEGWVQPSTSAWGTAILMVPKKDGSWRMCVDYRDLNALTIADAYPLPRIDDLLHRLGRATYFTKLDLQSGYHQIWIREEDRHKTAFRIGEPVEGHCHFEWRVMPFGLKNAPPTFQRYMTLVMNECTDCCLVYMDDLLVFSHSEREHESHVRRVFQALMNAQLKVKHSKCVFGATKVEFLGHTVTQGVIDMETSKKQAILRWESPLTSSRDVRKFMGLVSYYRNYVPQLATLSEPLTLLTRKRARMEWGWEAQTAMEAIKTAITDAHALTVWDPSLRTRVTTDASDVGMGAIIEQFHDNTTWKIVSAWSRKLSPCQRKYSTTDREWLAAVECITRVWKHWLMGKDFELCTDHAALREILTKKGEDFTHRQLRWYERLEPYSFQVTYIKGKDNHVPDALSRTPAFYTIKAIELLPMSPQLQIHSQTLQEALANDVRYTQLCNDPDKCDELKLSCNAQGLLQTSSGQICVPNNDVLRYKIVLEAHEPLFAGHFGERKTLDTVRRYWWWPHMKDTVHRVVAFCPICQCDATKKQSDEGPYRPILASAPWEVVTVDFVSGFTPSHRHRYTACCVVCDRFTRMIHLEACRDHATAQEAVGMMLRMIISRHGCPRIILSDRGTQFDSELWTEVWKMMGTRVAMASTHHPQTNGLTERCNRTLISLIRKYVHAHPGRWAEFLPLFEFAYNSSIHSTTQVAPFVADRGAHPPMPVSLLNTPWQLTEPTSARVQAHIYKLRNVLRNVSKLIHVNEERIRQQVANREARTRGNPHYDFGDQVLVYWPPFRAYADLARKHRLRYIGPFTVLRMIGQNAVELDGLPDKMPPVINTEYVHPYKHGDDMRLEEMRQSPPPPLPQ